MTFLLIKSKTLIDIRSCKYYIIDAIQSLNELNETLATRSKSKIKSKIIWSPQLGKELYKPIIGKIKKCKIHRSFNDNISDGVLI